MKYSIILFASLSLLGCKGDPGPAAPTLSGDVIGKVYLYADNGVLLQDKGGVQVSIDQGLSSTLTSSDGSWKLVGVPAGIHTLVFSKTGFFTRKHFGFQFVGGGTYYWGSSYMAQIPSVTVKQLTVSGPDTNNYVHFQGTLASADSVHRYVGIIFDKTPISSSPTVTFVFAEQTFIPADSISFSFSGQFGDYVKETYGLSTGSQLYARAYVMPNGGYYDNYNPFTGKYELYDREITFSNLVSITIR
jgi:hypothetical protein